MDKYGIQLFFNGDYNELLVGEAIDRDVSWLTDCFSRHKQTIILIVHFENKIFYEMVCVIFIVAEIFL